jgi:hypothetical protein
MSKEKTKYDLLEKVPETPKKTKKNKQKTECSINRRNGCGICGSLNTCDQGVYYCQKCGAEKEFLQDTYDWLIRGRIRICDCTEILWHTRNNPKHLQRIVPVSIREIHVEKCIDCGAVMGRFCPNGKHHRCWKSYDGKKFCKNCGYKKL